MVDLSGALVQYDHATSAAFARRYIWHPRNWAGDSYLSFGLAT